MTDRTLEEWQIEEIKKSLKEADAGEFASEEEVKAFFEKWSLVHDCPPQKM